MLEKSLLERVRKVNQIILQSIEEDLNIKSASDALSGIIDASVFVINRDGKLFSEVFNQQLSCQKLRDYLTTEASLPPYYDLPTLLKSNESRINELYRFSICPLDDSKNSSCPHGDKMCIRDRLNNKQAHCLKGANCIRPLFTVT